MLVAQYVCVPLIILIVIMLRYIDYNSLDFKKCRTVFNYIIQRFELIQGLQKIEWLQHIMRMSRNIVAIIYAYFRLWWLIISVTWTMIIEQIKK